MIRDAWARFASSFLAVLLLALDGVFRLVASEFRFEAATADEAEADATRALVPCKPGVPTASASSVSSVTSASSVTTVSSVATPLRALDAGPDGLRRALLRVLEEKERRPGTALLAAPEAPERVRALVEGNDVVASGLVRSAASGSYNPNSFGRMNAHFG